MLAVQSAVGGMYVVNGWGMLSGGVKFSDISTVRMLYVMEFQ